MKTRTFCESVRLQRIHPGKGPGHNPGTGPRAIPGGMPVVVLLLALCIVHLGRPAQALVVAPLGDGLIAVTLTIDGDTVEAAKQAASLQAVRASVGRLAWGQELIVAEELLGRYLENTHERFVRSIEPIRTDFVAGRPRMNLRVFVDSADLALDLREKRFLYRPLPRPFFKVFLAEQLDNEYATYATGRDSLTAAFQDRNLRPYDGLIDTPPNNADVAEDSILFEDALVACERRGVEVLVSGRSITMRDNEKELYYDTYYFYSTEMKAKLVRVDTAEILATVTARGTASHTEQQQAIDISIRRAASEAVRVLADKFDLVWGPMVLDKADYRILLTGVTPQTLDLVRQRLAGFSRDAQVYLRQSFDRSAVLTVVYPGNREDVIKELATMSYPPVQIVSEHEVIGKLTGKAQIAREQKLNVGRASGLSAVGEQTGELFTYRYKTDVTLNMSDRKTGVVLAAAQGDHSATSLEAAEAAIESWRTALGSALAGMRKSMPVDIQSFYLDEAVFTLVFPRELKTTAADFARRIRAESPLATVTERDTRTETIITMTYLHPGGNLLGRDPFLPDASLIPTDQRNWLEVQVGE